MRTKAGKRDNRELLDEIKLFQKELFEEDEEETPAEAFEEKNLAEEEPAEAFEGGDFAEEEPAEAFEGEELTEGFKRKSFGKKEPTASGKKPTSEKTRQQEDTFEEAEELSREELEEEEDKEQLAADLKELEDERLIREALKEEEAEREQKRKQKRELELNTWKRNTHASASGEPKSSDKKKKNPENRKPVGKAAEEERKKAGTDNGKENRKSGRLTPGVYLLGSLGGIMLVLLCIYGVLVLTVGREDGVKDVAAIPEKSSYTKEEVEFLVAEAREEAKAEESDRILGSLKENLTAGMAFGKALREFYPNDVVIYSGGRVRFFPIQNDLKKNTFDQTNLVKLDNGQLQYLEDGKVISHKGIDVSYHQGEIDWQAVAADGVEFAIIRVGIRGYGTGKVVLDEMFEQNIQGALNNGIKVGVYFYSHSINQEEVEEEVNLVLEQLAPYKITGPVVYDAEKVSKSRTSSISMEGRTAMAVTFCEAVKAAGYRPMLYLNLDTAFTVFDLTQLEQYDKWFAHYGTDMYYPYDYKIWQYSESGRVNGISSAVDLNISFEEWE